MKKLYRKGTVHPSPPPATAKPDDYLSFLPVAILALAVALSPEEKELLAYLLLYNAAKKPSSWFSGACDHAPEFGCDCFRCYMSYWARWDSSPNHQLIHDIIEAYDHEDYHRQSLDHQPKSARKAKNGKKEKRKSNGKEKGNASNSSSESKRADSVSDESTAESNPAAQLCEVPDGEREEGSVSTERGSNVRRLASFIGEKIWGVWG